MKGLKVLRELYDEPGWLIGHADGLLSRKQISVDCGIKSRSG